MVLHCFATGSDVRKSWMSLAPIAKFHATDFLERFLLLAKAAPLRTDQFNANGRQPTRIRVRAGPSGHPPKLHVGGEV